MSDRERMESMKMFIADNLAECCREMIEWNDTSILKDGKVRYAARHVVETCGSYSLSVVGSEVKFQAMKKVANEN